MLRPCRQSMLLLSSTVRWCSAPLHASLQPGQATGHSCACGVQSAQGAAH